MSSNTRSTVSLSDLAAQVRADREAQQAFQATVLGLLGNLTGSPVKADKAPKGKKAKAKKAPEGPSFQELRVSLRAHKAAGAIVPGVSVKQAVDQGLMDAQGNLPGVSKPKAAKAPKARKATVAKVSASQPAKVRAADGPRNALGHITPQSEWALRESLALTGEFDRHEIDAAVAKLASLA